MTCFIRGLEASFRCLYIRGLCTVALMKGIVYQGMPFGGIDCETTVPHQWEEEKKGMSFHSGQKP